MRKAAARLQSAGRLQGSRRSLLARPVLSARAAVPAVPRQCLQLGARPQLLAGATRSATSSAESSEPAGSALRVSAARLHESFFGVESTARIASQADAPGDLAAQLARLKTELQNAGAEELEVLVLGEALSAEGRKQIVVPGAGAAATRNVSIVLPNVEDMSRLLAERKKENYRVEKPEVLLEVLEKFNQEKFMGKRTDHVALVAAWGPKVMGDAEGEVCEVAALMSQSLAAYRAALACGGHVETETKDFQFEVSRDGDGRDCLVMPPSNFALLGLKDAVHNLLQGFRVLMVVQPHFFPHFREIQRDLAECGLPHGLFEVLPGITPEADPAVLHEALRAVDRLQFTGSSTMFKNLVTKAYELGNLRMEHGGEVSGLNKVRVDGVSASNPAVVAGSAWAAMANNGELCTSASLIEFDPATGDTAASVKAALEAQSTVRMGTEPQDATLNVLLRDAKSKDLEVKTESSEGLREWWEKTILAVPQGGSPNTRTNQSLGHCVFAPSIDRAVELGLEEDASCIYMVGVNDGVTGAPSARAGTTGCKLPESAFGGMKSCTYAVAGDHDGVGSIQTLLNTVKRRGASWRDQEEVQAKYELSEVAEMLIEFLNPRDQGTFSQQIANVLEVYAAFEPKVSAPYNGQQLVGAEGNSQLVSLKALKPTRKSLLIPKGVGLPDDIVKVALLCEMSPLRELPVDLHLLDVQRSGKLRVTDPLKSFLRVVERQLNWRIHYHADVAALTSWLDTSEYPPYFFCAKDKHVLSVEVLRSVAEQGGYIYEGLPDDELGVFRMMTATQAWTVSCTEAQVEEAIVALQKAWKTKGLREEPHEAPELVKPTKREMDIGGGFNAGMDPEDDKDWNELSSDSSSSSSDDEDVSKSTEKVAEITSEDQAAPAASKPEGESKTAA